MTTLLPTNRIASVDILRALTMVLMIFVNDLWSLQDIPLWLEHTSADEDGMGLADIVFPSFLFIVGMSLPFAVSSRTKKGDSDIQIIKHILIRASSLIVMGVFLVNGENLNEDGTGFSRLLWNVLSCTSFILIWNSYSEKAGLWVVRALKAIGWIMLIILAFFYRGGEGNDVHGFATYWWGILGLIGWAYLTAGISYVAVKRKLSGVIALWVAFSLISVLHHLHLIKGAFLKALLAPIGEGSMTAFVLGGAVISLLYLHWRDRNSNTKMLTIIGGIAAGLLAIGFLTRPLWGISKIHATPSWVWICSAITILTFILVYWISDLNGKASWFNFVKPAGTNTLLCYLIPYFAYAIVVWSGIELPAVMLTGIVGLLKSVLFALLVVFLAGRLGKLGLQLKL
jgi:heparan-alpha-glucosaminide N-acetyltransferase